MSIDVYSLLMDPRDECQMLNKGKTPIGITAARQKDAPVLSRLEHAAGSIDRDHVLEVVPVAVAAVQ
ncbi:MAG: hypothetical protein WAW16_00705 [Candidatus Cryosericum sp.]